MERLVEGYKAFRSHEYVDQQTLYEELGLHGQHPDIMLIGCADSRVDPTDIFHAYPGQMFVSRNVANLVPPDDLGDDYCCTMAAVEYAVTVIGVDMIVVMGHESCGGIAGCISGLGRDPDGGYVNKWLGQINHVHDKLIADGHAGDNMQAEMELESIRQSLKNLMTYEFIRTRVESGALKLQGAYFSIAKAELKLADETGVFNLIEVDS
jgi:carbonic anhydrase